MRARLLGAWAIFATTLALTGYGCGGGSSSPPPVDAHDAGRSDGSADRGPDLRADAVPDAPADAVDSASDAPRDGAGDTRDAADARDGGPAEAGTDVAAPTCSDHVKNSDETDIDCGGHCGKCAPTQGCLVGADCSFGVCKLDHTCGECNLASDCPGAETECVHRSCTAGVCGMSLAADGTVLAQQTVGDCQSRQCAADGTVKMVADNSDVRDDRNSCTDDTCTNGAPMNTVLPVNSSCGGQNRCNAAGQCVGCLTGADCPGSDTVCQTRTCNAGVCGFIFKPSGTTLNDPTAGDCKGQQCDGTGNIMSFNDNTDLPVDGNPCTTDECTAGTPAHHPVGSGTSCGTGLVCDGANHCVACLSASTCPGTDTECHTRTCINGACGVSNTAAGTVTSAQVPRDCKRLECNGSGGTFTVPDGTDLPVDGNACTSDICNGDTPANPAIAAGTNCGGTSVCDGAGACVGCLTAATCPGTDSECHTRTCSAAHMCSISNALAGKLLAIQVAGDCRKNQCDGNGNSQIVNDDTDLPVDNNVCTQDLCMNGAPSNPPLSQGSSCGPNLMCNGGGACVGCLTAADCPGMDTACQTRSCGAAGQCTVNNAPVGTAAGTQMAGDCKRSQCDGMGNIVTVADDNDVPVDGNQCTQDVCMNGVPSNPPAPADTACNQNGGSRCSGSAACVQCNTASQCPGGTDTECHTRACSAAGTCSVVNTASGTAVSTQTAGDCLRNQCDGAGNVITVTDATDVQDDGTSCTIDTCAGSTPAHTPVMPGVFCGDHGGSVCNATGACVGCNVASDCPGGPDTDCRVRACTQGACAVTFTAAGTAVSAQTAGDCHQDICDGAGDSVSVIDNTDVFVDGHQCTQDLCTGGVASNPPVTSGTMCTQNGGSLCDTAGTCVQCLTDANCDSSHDTACNKIHCVAGACTFVPEPANTAVADTATGDCHTNVCDGMGAETSIVNDNDVPVDGNSCTQDVCTGGVTTNPALTPGTACSQNGGTRCDASASCVPSFMVARIGDGTSTTLSSAGTAIFVEERIASDGTLVRVVNVPSVAGPPNPLTISGTADSEGALALSGDKHSVAIAGYSAAAGTTGVASTAGTATPRGAALIFANGTVDTSTTFGTTAFSANNVRSAVSSNGTQIWAAGDGPNATRGVFFAVTGATTSTLIESTTNAGRVCEITSGSLFCDAAKGVQGIFTFGATLPTAATTPTALSGTTADTNGSYYAFVLLDMIGNDGVLDTMYVADDRAAAPGGIQKWTLSSGTWSPIWNTNASASTTGVRGLTGYAVGGSAVLLATTASGSPTPNAIIRLVDSGTTPTAASITTLVPAVTGQVTVFRGIALAPQ